jgi:hypothetical protein
MIPKLYPPLSLLLASCGYDLPSAVPLCDADSETPAVRISEVLPNPIGDDAGWEYIELENRGAGPIDLSGWIVTHGLPEHTQKDVFVIPTGIIEPSRPFVLGGVLPEIRPWFVDCGYGDAFDLRNGGARLTLECDGTVVDEVVYPKSGSGVVFNRDEAATLCKALGSTPGFVNESCQSGAIE